MLVHRLRSSTRRLERWSGALAALPFHLDVVVTQREWVPSGPGRPLNG